MDGMKVAAAIDAAVQYEVGFHEQEHEHEKRNDAWRKRRNRCLNAQDDREFAKERPTRIANREFRTGNHPGPLGVVVPMPSVPRQNSVSLAQLQQQARCDDSLDQLDAIVDRQLKSGAIRPETNVTVLVVDPKTLETRASLRASGSDLLEPGGYGLVTAVQVVNAALQQLGVRGELKAQGG